ncbi:hypothetical protein F5B22DRAFT_565669 [Xylaria bambusicola]|uniref:uncharacterized protein n=1 Tax=Xylaria bambusicola TaxID=326684 RepID=UPI002008749D|nr:uncharacterized protein F5B22DRAFT_565669 [Xylaria bambusicola]KAI0521191.1 hypothetical protein F5B22DRAFT_565669 [Xylaria bambusicola]
MATASAHVQEDAVPQQCQIGPKHPELKDLVGAVFDQKFKIGQFIHEEYHFLAFSVESVPTPEIECGLNKDQNMCNFQARVYDFNNLSPKIKAYRSRNLKRIAKRTIVSENWRNRVVVIYRCGPVEELLGKEPADPSAIQIQSASQTPNLQHTETRKAPKPKSNYKRESDRLRQRDRRRAMRRRHHTISEFDTEPDIYGDVHSKIFKANKAIQTRKEDLDGATLYMLENMHLNSNPHPVILALLPPSLHQATREYLQARRSEIHFENDYEKSEYVEIKERELVEIRRLNKKVTSLIQEVNNKLEVLMQQKKLYHNGTRAWRQLENTIGQQFQWYMVLLAAETQLPAFAEEGRKQISIFRKETQRFPQMREETKNLSYRQWIRHIMPGSQAYAWLHLRL